MVSLKQLKTPVRYPGGKSRAVTKMDPYFPDLRNYDEFREPFLGGGSVAIYITKKYPSLDIWVNDLYEPLVNFWQQLQMFGDELKEHLSQFKSSAPDPETARELFNISKTILNTPNTGSFERAVRFYIVNKCSFRRHLIQTSQCVELRNCLSILN
jgi:DNA adenine methylase